jgi:hypothetical protein
MSWRSHLAALLTVLLPFSVAQAGQVTPPVPFATTVVAGKVKPDGVTTTTAADGTITATTGGTAGINQLTGDVTAGPAAGSAAATVAAIGGNAVSLGGALTFSGAFTTAFTVTGNTAITLPTTGTIANLASAQTFTNKVINCANNTCTVRIGSDVTGMGTGVATALGVNIGSAGAPVVNGGALGTPSSGTLTSATGLPISTGVSGLGTGVATFLATPSSANLLAALTTKTGTGSAVFGTGPTLSSLTLSDIATGTQCLHANSSGVISGTGTDCGAGGSTGNGVQGGQSPLGMGDNATALASGHYVYYTSANFTAARSKNLPDSATQGAGNIEIFDRQGTLTSSNTLTLCAAGTDTLNGQTAGCITPLNVAYAYLELNNDGAGKWTTGGSASIVVPVTVANGGTGRSTLTANALLTGNGTSTVNMVAITGLVKGNGASAPAAAVAGTDYAAAPTGSANTPLFNDGSGGFTNGTRSGNTTTVATASGTLTSTHCVQIDASGNFVDAGGTCTTGGGGGTVSSSTVGTVPVYTGATTVAGATDFSFASGVLTLGTAGSEVGGVKFNNATSGSITVQPVTGALGTRTLSLPAATDTLVGKATTDTLSNKTLDCTSGNTCTLPAASTSTAGIAKLHNIGVSAGWVATINPNNVVIGVVNQASTISAIIGAVEVATGGTSTVTVSKAPSGTACSAGTVLHSGSFNANGTAATNQTLTVTTSSLAAGDRLCLQTSGTTGWTSGTGVGTITVFYAPS